MGGHDVLAATILLVGLVGGAEVSTSDPGSAVDCGTSSLYTLLKLEGKDIPLDVLLGRVPGGARPSHSLAELRDCALAFGLRLRGVRLPIGAGFPDRPVLAYLNLEPHGHFVVVQRVGRSGTLVQVLDPGLEPEVMDANALRSLPGWSGIGLVPETGKRTTIVLLSVIAAASCMVILMMFRSMKRNH